MWHQEKNSNLVGHGESVLLVRLPSWGPDNSKVNLSWHGPSSWPSGQQNWPRSPGFNPCNLWTFVEEPVILKWFCCQCKREKNKIRVTGLMALDQKRCYSATWTRLFPICSHWFWLWSCLSNVKCHGNDKMPNPSHIFLEKSFPAKSKAKKCCLETHEGPQLQRDAIFSMDSAWLSPAKQLKSPLPLKSNYSWSWNSHYMNEQQTNMT